MTPPETPIQRGGFDPALVESALWYRVVILLAFAALYVLTFGGRLSFGSQFIALRHNALPLEVMALDVAIVLLGGMPLFWMLRRVRRQARNTAVPSWLGAWKQVCQAAFAPRGMVGAQDDDPVAAAVAGVSTAVGVAFAIAAFAPPITRSVLSTAAVSVCLGVTVYALTRARSHVLPDVEERARMIGGKVTYSVWPRDYDSQGRLWMRLVWLSFLAAAAIWIAAGVYGSVHRR